MLVDKNKVPTSRLLLPVAGQGSEAKIELAGEGGAWTQVCTVGCGRGACPRRGAPHLAAGTPAERNWTFIHRPVDA